MTDPIPCWALNAPFAAFSDRQVARGASLDGEEPVEGVWISREDWERIASQLPPQPPRRPSPE